ncbi:carboxymethylenebutenolidase-related protein [Salinispira pacifica]|uniref:Carboxymethylenebutenolidase-related protein n=1 Tax=Salinispira pacifica TaxID=1307761 RepID=V5WHG2_9SPIO|nr:carboxymethylenebutenolidase-related protein [Salinispira pacifica]AHC15272.1 carboxymethylenebutenolidase-related protein [Salinispira pacifica]
MNRRTRIKLITYGVLIGFMLFLALLFYLTTYYESEVSLEKAAEQAAQQVAQRSAEETILPGNFSEDELLIYEGDDFTALIPRSAYSKNREQSTFDPAGVKADRGLMFYPGAKVEGIAYGPLLLPLAARGYPVVILKFPFHFAILEQNAGRRAMPRFPSVEKWTLSGHSLGGTVAGWEALDNHEQRNQDNPPDFTVDSMIYLASYSDARHDLSGTDLKILSIAGESDGLISMEEIRERMHLFPEDARLVSIYGGNHAQFGSYGPQAGDAAAGISREAQQERTARLMLEFLEDL